MKDFFEEIWEEFTDFFEDFFEHLYKKPHESKKTKTTMVGGVSVAVRPAYLFAERIDNLLKAVFGLSISISAFTATFLGFASLSELIDVLIATLWGRSIMVLIGLSYLLLGLWKLLHLNGPSKP